MAKSENPIDIYRRQQRKKELKKNKTARIQARDAKVAATRTVEEVQAEISALERRRDRFGKKVGGHAGGHDNDYDRHTDSERKEGLDSAQIKKLERLRKELKIVTAATKERQAQLEQRQLEEHKELLAKQKTVEGVKKINEEKYSLVQRFASVYYDENMNPFGAPPPGQPSLYYCDDEGKATTRDVRGAVVPKRLRDKFDGERKKRGLDKQDIGDGNYYGCADSMASDPSAGKRRRLWDDSGNNGNVNQQQMKQPQQSQQLQYSQPGMPPSGHVLPPPSQNNTQFPTPPPPHPHPNSSHLPTQQMQQPPPPPPRPNQNPSQPPPPPLSQNIANNMPPQFPPPPPPPPSMPPNNANATPQFQIPPPPLPHTAPPLPPFPPSHPPPLPPTAPPPPPPKSPPKLPPPSKAVVRASKKKAVADIWASQEEMEYHQGLEGVAELQQQQQLQLQQQQPYLPRWQRNKLNRMKNKAKEANGGNANTTNNNNKGNGEEQINDPCCPSADGYAEYRNREQIERQALDAKKKREEREKVAQQHVSQTRTSDAPTQIPTQYQNPTHPPYDIQQPAWYYRDNSTGAIQGPFSGYQMMIWKNARFFPLTTPVRYGGSGDKFVAMSEMDFAVAPVSSSIPPPPPPPPPPAQAAEAHEIPPAVEAAWIKDDFVNVPPVGPAQPLSTNENQSEPNFSKAQLAKPTPSDDDECLHESDEREGGTEVDMCLPPPSDDDEAENEVAEADICIPPPSDDEDQHAGGEADICLPPPSDDEDGYDDEDGNENVNDENEQLQNNHEEPPAYYPPPEDHVADVPYPVDVEYPLPDDDGEPAYPADVEYPATDDLYAYPNTDDAYGEYDIPAVAPYPTEDDAVFGTVEGETIPEQHREIDNVVPPPVEEKKKKFEGDKEIVGFMPTNLRVKRKNGDATKKAVSRQKQTTAAEESQDRNGKDEEGKKEKGYSVADDYDKFMEEISALK